MVEFLPHMEESIDLANYLGHDQNFSNCNDLPSSTVRNITGTRVLVPGHQNSGAPTYFFRVFSSLHAHSC